MFTSNNLPLARFVTQRKAQNGRCADVTLTVKAKLPLAATFVSAAVTRKWSDKIQHMSKSSSNKSGNAVLGARCIFVMRHEKNIRF